MLHLAAVALHAADGQAAHLGVEQRLEDLAQAVPGRTMATMSFTGGLRSGTATDVGSRRAAVESPGDTRMAPSPVV